MMSFPRKRESSITRPRRWIPAFAGMTERRPSTGRVAECQGPNLADPPGSQTRLAASPFPPNGGRGDRMRAFESRGRRIATDTFSPVFSSL